MEDMGYVLIAIRVFQLAFATVVLGLSISIWIDVDNVLDFCDIHSSSSPIKVCHYGRLPSSSIFAAFTGAWGIFDVIVGLVGAFSIASMWGGVVAVDGLTTIFYVASGINLAVLRVGGCDGSFCAKWTTITVFQFLGAMVTVFAIAAAFIARADRKHSPPPPDIAVLHSPAHDVSEGC